MRAFLRPRSVSSQLIVGASALLFAAACNDAIDYTPSSPDTWPDSGVFDLPQPTPDAPPPVNNCLVCHGDQEKLEAVADPVPPPPEPTGES